MLSPCLKHPNRAGCFHVEEDDQQQIEEDVAWEDDGDGGGGESPFEFELEQAGAEEEPEERRVSPRALSLCYAPQGGIFAAKGVSRRGFLGTALDGSVELHVCPVECTCLAFARHSIPDALPIPPLHTQRVG